MIEDVKNLPPMVLSAALAVFIAVVRVMYQREETSVIRCALEAVLCGLLAVVAGTAVQAMGLNENWTLFSGGAIGFMGSHSIRAYAEVWFKQKANTK